MNQQEVKALVQAALDGMQIPWRGEGEWLRLTTQVRGRTIPVALHLRDERLTLYARLPLQGEEGRMALACNALNRVLGDGCLVADERGQALLKQTLYLSDALYAAQTVERALAGNAFCWASAWARWNRRCFKTRAPAGFKDTGFPPEQGNRNKAEERDSDPTHAAGQNEHARISFPRCLRRRI